MKQFAKQDLPLSCWIELNGKGKAVLSLSSEWKCGSVWHSTRCFSTTTTSVFEPMCLPKSTRPVKNLWGTWNFETTRTHYYEDYFSLYPTIQKLKYLSMYFSYDIIDLTTILLSIYLSTYLSIFIYCWILNIRETCSSSQVGFKLCWLRWNAVWQIDRQVGHFWKPQSSRDLSDRPRLEAVESGRACAVSAKMRFSISVRSTSGAAAREPLTSSRNQFGLLWSRMNGGQKDSCSRRFPRNKVCRHNF